MFWTSLRCTISANRNGTLGACILAEKHGCMYPYFIKKSNSEYLF
jgi:hypothetical protein